MIETQRMRLRPWREADRDAFAALLADPEVMRDHGGPLDRAASDAKFDGYGAAFRSHGFCRWAIEDRDGGFLGYVGVMPVAADHPLGPHLDIGWRLLRRAWGHGFATEGAQAALRDVFARIGPAEILAYAAADNARSQGVMARLGLRRDPARDFTALYDGRPWRGLVWVARPDAALAPGQGRG